MEKGDNLSSLEDNYPSGWLLHSGWKSLENVSFSHPKNNWKSCDQRDINVTFVTQWDISHNFRTLCLCFFSLFVSRRHFGFGIGIVRGDGRAAWIPFMV